MKAAENSHCCCHIVTHASHLKMIDLFPAGDVIRVHHFEQEEMTGHRYSSEEEEEKLEDSSRDQRDGGSSEEEKAKFLTREKRKGH